MADSLVNILNGRGHNEPPEIRIIKNFVRERFGSDAKVTVSQNLITIGVNSASLAGNLRLSLHELKEDCKTDKRLVIRIS